MALAVAVFVVAAVIWAVVELAAVAGFFGVLMGERLERCGHCGRFGLTSGGVRHPDGCAPHLLAHLHGLRHYFHRPHIHLHLLHLTRFSQ